MTCKNLSNQPGTSLAFLVKPEKSSVDGRIFVKILIVKADYPKKEIGIEMSCYKICEGQGRWLVSGYEKQ